VVTGAAHAEEIRRQIPELDHEVVLAEPQGRNTAPCIAWAAYKLLKRDPDAIMVVLPADHLIAKEDEFRRSLEIAIAAASSGDYLVTFGIVPCRPETGYGYVRMGPPAFDIGLTPVFRAESFVEKPCRAVAEEYIASGSYLWNSGMFVWRAKAIKRAFDTHLPSVSRAMDQIAPALDTSAEKTAIGEAYAGMESVSIDFGIMEKADNVLAIPISCGWSDVGCWTALEEVWERDDRGNAVNGNVVMLDGERCIVFSPEKMTVVIGADDLVVVDTPDALMVCRKDRAQDVRRLQQILKERGYDVLL
jgi:mannose-1-phosphate guanylyltransferase